MPTISGTESSPAEFAATYAWNGVNLVVTAAFFTALRVWRVTAIRGRVTTAGIGGAATFIVYKAPSATAIGSGTALHTGSFDLVGTANGNQTLTLSSTASDLLLAVGDSIGLVLAGVPTSAAGALTIEMVAA